MIQRYTFIAAVLTFLCLLVISSAASTVSVPDPFFYGSLNYNVGNTTVTMSGPGSYSTGPVSAAVMAMPNASSSLNTACSFAYSYPNVCNPSGAMDIVYYFTVTGGTVGDPVNVLADGLLRAATGSSNVGSSSLVQAYAAFSVSVNGNAFSQVLTNNCVGLCSWQQSWSGTFSVPMLVGDVATVELNTQVSLWEGAPGAVGSAYAYADPYIYVDPNDPNASLYSIVVSPGIGNVPLGTTPEPSSLTLLSSGIVGLATVLRRAVRKTL